MRILSGLCLILFTFAAHAEVQTMQAQSVGPIQVQAPAQTQVASTSDYTNLKLRDERKIGVGAEIGGESGILGALLELNVVDEDATQIGVGFGNTYSTFSVAWKHSFEGKMFTPYTTVGWSHWYGNGGSASKSHILDEMLTSSERDENRFGIDLAMAGFGAQYQELTGDFAGASWFGEVDMAMSPMRGKIMPTAAVGAMYFF